MINKLYKLIKNRKGFIFFSFLKISVQILTLVTNIFIVRKISVYDFGVYSLLFTLVGFAATFGFAWSSSAILYYGSKEKASSGNLNKTFWARNIILFVSFIIITAIFIVFQKSINSFLGAKLVFLALVWIYIRIYEDYLENYLLAIKKQYFSSIILFISRLVFLLIVLISRINIKNLIIYSIVSELVTIAYLWGINKKDFGKFEFDLQYFKEILSFSLWQLFGFSGLYVVNFGDNIVIKYFMTVKDVGIYNVAYKLFDSICNMASLITAYYAAFITEWIQDKNIQKLRLFFYRERYLIFGLSTFLHILILLFSKPLIHFFYGMNYDSSIIIFNVLILGSIIRYYTVFYILYLNTSKKYHFAQLINFLRAVLNLGLDIILIKFFGLLGPAIATSLSIIITAAIIIIYCEKRMKYTWDL